MAIASPSPPTISPSSFSCTRSDSPITTTRLTRFPSTHHHRFPPLRLTTITSSSNPRGVPPDKNNGDIPYELLHGFPPPQRRRRGGAPVYVTLPVEAVGSQAVQGRWLKVLAQSFRALLVAGVEGVVMEVWWGIVEMEQPRVYNWSGYLDLVALAKRCGLKVKAVLAFHQRGTEPNDPHWIPLPQWVLEEIDNNPDLVYSDRFGRRNMECISLGCDTLPVLRGRSPVQTYTDFMRNFKEVFRPYLGAVITGIQVGMGPAGELRYPSCSSQKLTWGRHLRELGEFQCYDKYMLASLNACAQKIGIREWGYGGPIGTGNLTNDPEHTEFFRSEDGAWNTPYGKFFLEWYSGMLLLHGERICREAENIFRGTQIYTSAKVAGIHWHYGTQSHPSELTAGYYNTLTRNGYLPIARIFARHEFTLCCNSFEMRDVKEKQLNPVSSPEGFLRQLLLAARVCGIPLEGENSAARLDDESYQQVLKMSKFYSDGLERPSFSFNLVRMDKNMFDNSNWISFTRFVKQMSDANIFRAKLDFGGDMDLWVTSDAAKAGMALAYC
ncbi:Glyco_hydro_14 domain-containing protein [Cephalotus follicularis]|uniref:Beta-amylase n=1 Tax=Cephalotus follicularis TaxID=3775 RepID=A0A1Q3BKZ2_CEPFO|nr:Glyco_hydro_14 domain-containing protein [Cephalotus follicularis]